MNRYGFSYYMLDRNLFRHTWPGQVQTLQKRSNGNSAPQRKIAAQKRIAKRRAKQ